MGQRDAQLDLFGLGPKVLPASPSDDLRRMAGRLPAGLRLGGSTWSYPGWQGHVYADAYSPSLLSNDGLKAYAQHPLLRTVGIDRTFYAPLPTSAFREYAQQVPPGFRFVVKALEECTRAWIRGQPNPRFLDAAYAADQVVAPLHAGLGEQAGLLLFQFPPQDVAALGGVDPFINRLYRFLRALPPGLIYAVEVRNEELLTPRFAQALAFAGAVPTLAGWGNLPPLREQADRTRAREAPLLFLRWMLHWGLAFEEAEERFAPFDRLHEPLLETRNEVVGLAQEALAANKPVYVIVGNSAEGCAPLTLRALAESLQLPDKAS